MEKQLASRRGRVEVLLIEIEIDADGFEILDGAQEIDEGAAESIDGLAPFQT